MCSSTNELELSAVGFSAVGLSALTLPTASGFFINFLDPCYKPRRKLLLAFCCPAAPCVHQQGQLYAKVLIHRRATSSCACAMHSLRQLASPSSILSLPPPPSPPLTRGTSFLLCTLRPSFDLALTASTLTLVRSNLFPRIM